ncbi:MAG: dihydrofolate reductase family protein [bacterium]
MRKVVASLFQTLDGVIEAPQDWSFAFWNDEISKYKNDELFTSDALLLGRVTYELFASAWPSRTDDTGFADRINNLRKYVVSTTLERVEWNNSHLLKGNIAKDVELLKQQQGQDILIGGSASLVQTLLDHDLVDEIRLLVYPVVLGRGKRLFGEKNKATLKRLDTKAFGDVVAVTYAPVKSSS